MEQWERTTDTPTVQFFEFMKFLAENDLMDSASSECEGADLGTVRISVEHIRVIQDMIQKRTAQTAGATAVILSAHVDGAC